MRSLCLILVAVCAACAPERHSVTIQFDVRLDGEPLSCNSEIGGLQLTDLRFYVTDLRLRADDSAWHSLSLTRDDLWQSEQVAMIDLESGEGSCLNGSPDINATVRGTLASIPQAGLAFTVGVPESLNHADPLVAAAPLGYTVMHWHWASGYKFMRAGIRTDDDGFFLHLGSNRCTGTITDIRGCRGANRVTVKLADFRAGEHVVVLDIGTLFGGVNLQDGISGECMSGPANDQCIAPFNALGIDFESGEMQGSVQAFSLGQPR